MRMSCNGCRVLRKGCSENCSIRPCLQWIKSPESQANATVFLAKIYGRAGLMNLINAGPDHLRPAIFRSLLYEACGRIVNPIYGSVGLLWSGSWQLCQAAVEAVLKGTPIMQISSDAAASTPVPPLKAYDIRHVSKDHPDPAATASLHKVAKATRTRFKRSAATKPRPAAGDSAAAEPADPDLCNLSWSRCYPQPARSHESSGSHAAADGDAAGDGDSRENESMFSVETVEASDVSQGEPNHEEGRPEGEVELDLTLGLEPAGRGGRAARSPSTEAKARCQMSSWGADTHRDDLGVELPA